MKDKFKFNKNNLMLIVKNQYFYYCIEIFIGLFLSIIFSFTICHISFLYGYLFSLLFILGSIFLSAFFPKIVLKNVNNPKKLKLKIILFYCMNIFILVLVLIIAIFLKLYNVDEIDIYGILDGIIIYIIVAITIKYFWYKQTIKNNELHE